MKLKLVRYISLLLLVFWMALIFLFSNQTADISDDTSDSLIEKVVSAVYPQFDNLDNADKLFIVENYSGPVRKSAHFTEYAVLGVLASAFFMTFRFKANTSYITVSFTCGFIYAVSDEIHQLFVPGRACMVLDVYIDSAGVLLGVLLFYLIYSRE